MKKLNVKRAAISALIIYVLGVSAFIASHFVPIMSDPEAQANLVLMIAITPAAIFGAFLYYRRGHETNGILLGAFLFLLTIVLDALITVPLFVIPAGGNHLSFFGDPGFWLIGVEYVLVVAAYWQVHKVLQARRVSSI
ncbi:MAG: DUF5367 domain-containing protein [Cyanothece sp. SIO1E1]|nr:DUF5367 domain-containing protein [Cyanothece sp. SIO1E1]